ncbi:MAG: HAMP domain-containing histidine kinase [Lachnospiraceae bacterium]|nr:HAMP domain-containing histidine kinase [Lachnospiraceae bacterium]
MEVTKAKRRMILYALLALGTLLAVLLAVINGLNFTMAADDADRLTEHLIREGTVPPAQEKPGNFGPMGPGSPEMGFSLRYFTVRFVKGEPAEMKVFRLAAVTEEEAVEWAKSLKNGADDAAVGWTRGTYRYRVLKEGDTTLVTVIDQGREMLPAYRTLWISAAGWALALIAGFAILAASSGRIFGPIEEADRKQKQFLRSAENEFTVPLTVIAADTELLEKNCGSSEETQSMRRQLSKLFALSDELAGLRILEEDSGEKTRIDLSALLRETAETARPAFASRGLTLTVEAEEGVTLTGDAASVRRMLEELLSNAEKFSLTGAALRLTKEGERIVLEAVSDTDLPDQPAERIFDRFVRLENAAGKDGAGLGLTYVRDCVKGLQGRVSAAVAGGQFVLKALL